MEVDFRVTIAGVTFKNPLLAASANHVRGIENTARIIRSGVGGIVCKSVTELEGMRGSNRARFAILDETDSGLDADAVRLASQSIAAIGEGKMGILIITHHERLLEHNRPDRTHVMLGGRIVETGGPELAGELHRDGFDRIRADYPEAAEQEQAMKTQEATEVATVE